ncbi:MAG: hypothetical protein ACR2ND_10520 [Solirubrobacteraceae bacterium]
MPTTQRWRAFPGGAASGSLASAIIEEFAVIARLLARYEREELA